MSQPVKLSDRLVLNARLVGELSERSIAGQIEFWARLGQAVESVLRADDLLRVKQHGDAVDFDERLRTVDSPAGRARVDAVLAAEPFPHFQVADGRPGYLVRIDADGTRTIGRFIKRAFRAEGDAREPSKGERPATKRARAATKGARAATKGERAATATQPAATKDERAPKKAARKPRR